MNCVRMKLAVNLMLISLAKHAQVAFTRQAFGVPTGILNHHYATIQTNKSVWDEMCRDEICPGMKGVVNLMLIPLAGHAQVCFLKTSIGCPINWGN